LARLGAAVVQSYCSPAVARARAVHIITQWAVTRTTLGGVTFNWQATRAGLTAQANLPKSIVHCACTWRDPPISICSRQSLTCCAVRVHIVLTRPPLALIMMRKRSLWLTCCALRVHMGWHAPSLMTNMQETCLARHARGQFEAVGSMGWGGQCYCPAVCVGPQCPPLESSVSDG
jgi:hypothetical protein